MGAVCSCGSDSTEDTSRGHRLGESSGLPASTGAAPAVPSAPAGQALGSSTVNEPPDAREARAIAAEKRAQAARTRGGGGTLSKKLAGSVQTSAASADRQEEEPLVWD